MASLDGLTIMRYAHIYRDRVSGGVEQYLRQLNQGLLERHRLTILQMHLVRSTAELSMEPEELGLGRLVWIPVLIRQDGLSIGELTARLRCLYERQQLGREKKSGCLALANGVLQHHAGHLRYGSMVLSEHLCDLLLSEKVDLLSLHWINYETAALVHSAEAAHVPFVFINHFDNARLGLSSVRRCIAGAAGIGGVSCQGVPSYLKERYTNLSDAVDTNFFAPEKVRAASDSAGTVLLLPSRIVEGKGHRDLIDALAILLSRRIDVSLYFAGAVDSDSLDRKLRVLASRPDLRDRVVFSGEQDREQLRDLYAQSAVVVLPSETEGLGRVLLEAQAMGKPVVAYDSGGIREALLPGETGFLVKKGDWKGLADNIEFLLKHETERQQFGRRGRQFVCERFSIDAMIKCHESFYAAILGRQSQVHVHSPSAEVYS